MSADDKATAKNRSPIKIAEEAIKANSGSKDGLPPVLNLGGGASIDAVDMISESIMSKIKMNTLNTALKMSEKLSNDAEAAVAPRSSVPGQVSSIPQPLSLSAFFSLPHHLIVLPLLRPFSKASKAMKLALLISESILRCFPRRPRSRFLPSPPPANFSQHLNRPLHL